MPREPVLPEQYRGKETGFIKHELLRAYLEKLFLIVGMAAERLGVKEICYVDCFAGPWLDESEDLNSTSIAISLGILEECGTELKRRGKEVTVRALYVEQKPDAYRRLRAYLDKHPAGHVLAQSREGDFVSLRDEIIRWCGPHAFAFFFIDPTNWRPIGIDVLQPLLARPKSEFLINFMYDFITRFAEVDSFRKEMRELLGEEPELHDRRGAARERELLGMYRRNLKARMPEEYKWPARSAYARVLDPTKDRTKYHLVYLTTHPHGIVVFMEISESVELVQRIVRASTKQAARIEKTGQGELFGPSAATTQGEPTIDISDVERAWLARLSATPIRFDEGRFATFLEETDWFPQDLQDALGNLIRSGKVRNLDAARPRRTRFLHYDSGGERLQLVTEAK